MIKAPFNFSQVRAPDDVQLPFHIDPGMTARIVDTLAARTNNTFPVGFDDQMAADVDRMVERYQELRISRGFTEADRISRIEFVSGVLASHVSSQSITAPTEDTRAWARGYYAAVAVLLREEGCVTSSVMSLYRQGGGAEFADEADTELFRAHGLTPPGR